MSASVPLAARLRFGAQASDLVPRFLRGESVRVWADFFTQDTQVATTPAAPAFRLRKPDGSVIVLATAALGGAGATRHVDIGLDQAGTWHVLVMDADEALAERAAIVAASAVNPPDGSPQWVDAQAGAVITPTGQPVTAQRLDLLPPLGTPQDTDLLPAVRGSAAGSYSVADFRAGLGAAPVTSVAGRTGAVTLAVADVAGAVAATRALTAGTGLTGGGDLSADRSLSLSTASIASLALADSAVQPGDLVAASRVIWVDPAGDDTAAGDLPTAPKRSIAAAVSAAVSGDVIRVRAGTYTEPCPMVLPRDVSVVGDGLRVVTVRPTTATAGNTMWLVDSGAYLTGMTFAGHQAGAWAVAFNAGADNTALGASGPGAFILKSPYVQNCTSYTAQDDGGLAGSTSDGTTGGGLLVDGAACAPNSPIRSMVVDSFTQINLDGPGCLVTNDAYAQLVSFFGTFCSYHVKATNGGQVNLSNSTTDFGTYGLVADGRSTTPIFTGQAAAAAAGANQIAVTNLTANRLGVSNRPASGMVFDVGGGTYTVIGATPTAGGHVVTFYPVLAGALAGNETVEVFLRSQIATGSHVMEYVGAGTNYLALPWNGGVPIPANEIVELNGGRVFFSTTDHLGNFRVGPQFDVNGTTGAVTINTTSFNLSGLNFIGPFSRDGGVSSVGVQLREVSNNTSLLASTGAADGNTVPTQFAVVSYLTANYTPLTRTLTAGTGLSGGGDLSANRTLSLSTAATASLALADSAVQPARSISAGTGLTGGGDLSADRTIGLADTAVTAGSYGSGSAVATFSVDAQGRLTAAGTASITPGAIGAAAAVHGHAIADVTGLQAALDAKLDDAQASAFGLTLLDDADAATARGTLGLGSAAVEAASAFAAASHTHAAAAITDFAEAVDDRVATLLAAGSNVTLAYDDAAGTLTIASAPPASGAGSGTVTSVDVSGGTTGLTASGGPITSTGTITLAGTLAVANGGTGATDAAGARSALGAAALGANTYSGAQNLADNELLRALMRDYAEVVATPAIASGVLTLDMEAANVFDVSLNADISTLTISNPPASGRAGSLTLILTADGTPRAVTWGAAIKWPGGSPPALSSAAGAQDVIVMTTRDAGATWLAIVAGQAF